MVNPLGNLNFYNYNNQDSYGEKMPAAKMGAREFPRVLNHYRREMQ